MRQIIYIHEQQQWPVFTWSNDELVLPLTRLRFLQGRIIGQMSNLGFLLQQEANLNTLTLDVLKSNEIEGNYLQSDQVRSSIARHLGMDILGLVPSDRHVDGVVEMLLDATQQYDQPLSDERLFGWHAALFPTGRSGTQKIITGHWRRLASGPMQVVSGGIGQEKVHFQAPDATRIEAEMSRFINWFNLDQDLDPVVKAAIAHLWFITIHPFEDGNGRIARAITDLQLSKADQIRNRFYSMSAQIRIERTQYYELLERTQKGNLDITAWLIWFVDCLFRALQATETTLMQVLNKARFWEVNSRIPLNERQHLMLNKLLDGFEGNLTSSKWAKITKCSPDTALRDMQDLIDKNILEKGDSGGRSTNYYLRNAGQ